MATIDSSIPLGVRQFQAPDQMNALARVMQLKGIQQQGELGQMKMEEMRSNIARTNKLAQLAPKGVNALREGGFWKEAMEMEEGAAKIDNQRAQTGKYQADTEKARLQTTFDKLKLGAQILSTAKDQASYEMARAEAQAKGLDVSRMPPQFDPVFVQSKLQESMSMAEQLEQQWKAKGYDLDVQKVAETRRHNRSTEGLTARGQNMADARAREANTAGKVPSGYRLAANGQGLEYIPGGPADPARTGEKAPSEGERKAATLLQRLEGSQRQLQAALKADPAAAKPQLFSSGLRSLGMEAAANANDHPARQQVEAAQLDMLDAALTLGTGAAYTREQLEGYRRSYFPQVGDDEATVKDKKDRLANVIQAAKIAAGRAKTSKPATTAADEGKVVDFGSLK